MKNRTLLLLCACWVPVFAKAQHTVISGYVTEKKSGERLIGATVVVPGKNIGTVTNNFGFYSLTVPGDSFDVRASYIGFQGLAKSIKANTDPSLNFELEEAQALREVMVTAKNDLPIQEKTQMSSIDLPISTIKSLPAFLGEVDILKAIQLLPGVQAGSEGSSGLYVRGGGADQNLIMLDGVPVYNASHLFGFFSVFNADAVKNVSVIKGGFPARYGGRLSSVIEINMKDGDKNKLHGEGGIGLVASRLTLEGPIRKGRSSFVVSGRRTYIDAFMAPFSPGTRKVGYYFYDLNGKLNFILGKKDNLYLSGYFGNDKFYDKPKKRNTESVFSQNSLIWGNTTAVARWNHEFSPNLFGNLTAYYSRYRFQLSDEWKSNASGSNEGYQRKYSSGIGDKAIKYDVDFYPGPGHSVKAGFGFVAHRYEPSAVQNKITTAAAPAIDTTTGDAPLNAGEYDAYIEDDIKLSDRLKINAGLHWTGFSVQGKFFSSLQPRVSARYLINDRLSAKASYAQMNQFIHLLTNSSVNLPTDLWLPATGKVPGQVSHQVASGIAYTHKTGIEISAEAYYKAMDHVIEYKDGASFMNRNSNWEDKVEIGKGTSYGAELFVQKKKGRFTGMLGYTLSWTNRRFDNLNNGKAFPYRYDRRHDFKIAGVYQLTPGIEIGAEWVYGSGNSITMPAGTYSGVEPESEPVTIYGSRNGYRMKAYHRGDVSIKFLKHRKRSERAWVLAAYNVYNRKNPFYIYNKESKFYQFSLFGIIPSISYQFKF